MKALLLTIMLAAMPTGWADSEPGIDETVVWLNRNLPSDVSLYDLLFTVPQHIEVNRSRILLSRVGQYDKGSSRSYIYATVLFSELVADAHIDDYGRIVLSCAIPRCVEVERISRHYDEDHAEWIEVDRSIADFDKRYLEASSYQNNPEQGQRIVNALNHLILLSGGLGPVKEDLF